MPGPEDRPVVGADTEPAFLLPVYPGLAGRGMDLAAGPDWTAEAVFENGLLMGMRAKPATRQFHVHWGTFGPQFSCAECGVALVSAHDAGILEHGDLRVTQKRCPGAGRRFKHPFAMMALEELSPDAESSSPDKAEVGP